MAKNFAITIPAGTLAADPYNQFLKLSRGMIQRATIHFPAGCQYRVHVQVRRGGHQIWPEDDDKDLAYEDYTWESISSFPLLEEPYELKLLAWSPECDYDHVIRVGVDIMTEDTYGPLQSLIDAMRKFFKLVGVLR